MDVGYFPRSRGLIRVPTENTRDRGREGEGKGWLDNIREVEGRGVRTFKKMEPGLRRMHQKEAGQGGHSD